MHKNMDYITVGIQTTFWNELCYAIHKYYIIISRMACGEYWRSYMYALKLGENPRLLSTLYIWCTTFVYVSFVSWYFSEMQYHTKCIKCKHFCFCNYNFPFWVKIGKNLSLFKSFIFDFQEIYMRVFIK